MNENKNLVELIKDVQIAWTALLLQGIPMIGEKKSALRILKQVLAAQENSLKILRFEKKEIFLGDLTPQLTSESKTSNI